MRAVPPNFITEVIDRDLAGGRHDSVMTRFPPEPNGYLHIGHVKAICINYGIAADYGGEATLRMDDTNPTTEDPEYVEAIRSDIEWLGFSPRLTYASDDFEAFYQHARGLVTRGLAYVDSLNETQIREYRGTVTEPGRPSPYRERSVEENLDLFARMRAGEFEPGEHVLRAKIDMSSPNMVMRDPILYRIRKAHHYRTGDEWPIYPLYDYAHPLNDALEGVTHSLCSLEFETRRELYDWVVDNTVNGPARPHQYEFARLFLDYTVTSKRKLIHLVESGLVAGWDDPRMPTLAAFRRRGVTPEAIRDFVGRLGVNKTNARTDIALLEHSIRDNLNTRSPRVLAVLEPLRVTISNYDAPAPETLMAPYWPPDVPREGERGVPFGRSLLIERGDFAENPPAGFKRLSPGQHVRLRHAYVIRCDEVVKDDAGNVTELICSYLPESLGVNPEGVSVRGAIHWLEASSALPAEFRLYDRLFTVPEPDADDTPFTEYLNPDSLRTRHGFVEPSVAGNAPGTRYQFERLGYFWRDPIDSSPERLVFNRIVTLRDSWARRATAEETTTAAGAAGATPADAGARRPQRTTEDPGGTDGGRQPDAAALAFAAAHSLEPEDAAMIQPDDGLRAYFLEALAALPGNGALLGRWLVNEVQALRKDLGDDGLKLAPAGLAELVGMVADGHISARTAKDVLAEAAAGGASPGEIVRRRNLVQVSDEDELGRVVAEVLAANPAQVAAWRAGKTGLAGYFVGQVMKGTGGRANPQLVAQLVERALSS